MRAIIKHPLPMKIATYNVNSIRRHLPIVLDWIAHHKPDVMCLQETKVQDHEFPVDAIRDAGYHASFRGMKAYSGVATLTRTPPDKIIHGLHEGEDNEDFRIIQTVVSGIPIINKTAAGVRDRFREIRSETRLVSTPARLFRQRPESRSAGNLGGRSQCRPREHRCLPS
jgi:exodeoxyribonuclease III